MQTRAAAKQFNPKSISIIGSTGSIGENVLRVVRAHREHFRIVSLAARSNADRLFEQSNDRILH